MRHLEASTQDKNNSLKGADQKASFVLQKLQQLYFPVLAGN